MVEMGTSPCCSCHVGYRPRTASRSFPLVAAIWREPDAALTAFEPGFDLSRTWAVERAASGH